LQLLKHVECQCWTLAAPKFLVRYRVMKDFSDMMLTKVKEEILNENIENPFS
jgi:hypothetical protein